jgi:hypothetical protein
VRALAVVCLLASVAHADDRLHGSVGAGSTLVMTGAEGDRFRFDASFDLKPRSRFGLLLAWRAFDPAHRGLVTAGISYEGAASRPRLVLDLHADVGIDLDRPAPLGGGGVRATLMIIGPLAAVLDTGAFLVLDGIDGTRLQLQGATLLAARW